MKNPSIEALLERYRQGTLSDSELSELNRLTHRDEVMAQADRRATVIVRRRRTALFTVAGLLLAGATVFTILLPQRSEAPLVAEAKVPEPVVTTVETVEAPSLPVQPAVAPQAQVQAPATIRRSKPAVRQPQEEQIVMCNNQCEADSVISDIWKFLTA